MSSRKTLFAVGVLFAAAAACAAAADMSSVARYGRPAPTGPPWSTAQRAKLQNDITKILTSKALRGAHIGLYAVETQSGNVLYSRNADEEFMPASNFKLLTGSAALDKLGASFTYETTVSADTLSGAKAGNLYLHGTGDALLRAKDLDDAAATIAARGISHVNGSVVTDASYFDAQRYGFGWSWDDLPYYYAPVITALELEDGVLHVYMSPGAAVGAPVVLRMEPLTDAVHVENDAVTGPAGSKDTTDIVRNFDDWHTIHIPGSYPLGSKESGDIVPAVADPESYAGDVLLKALSRHGISVAHGVVRETTPANAQTLWTHESEPLPQLLADFWYPSDNLMGELFLKRLGVLGAGTPGTDDKGIAVENAWLTSIGIDPTTVTISDGSGLSQYDRITPHDLVTILQHDWNSPNRDIVLDALPVSGVRGSLKSQYIGTPAEKNVFAKTGSISHVRTISGFLRTQHHGTVTFSFMLDDWMEDPPALAKLRGDLFSTIISE